MFRGFLNVIFRVVGGLFNLSQSRQSNYSLKVFEDRRSAVAAAQVSGLAAVVRSGNNNKWLLFKCPCGCKQQIALNLMEGHIPRWKVEIQSPTSFSVYPSVDATSCGAHFWLKNGVVIWAD
jgi:hypothetical protein